MQTSTPVDTDTPVTDTPVTDTPVGDPERQAQLSGRWITAICVLWSLFQLWIVSDVPFFLSEITGLKLVFNGQEARQIHLAFGLGLALSVW